MTMPPDGVPPRGGYVPPQPYQPTYPQQPPHLYPRYGLPPMPLPTRPRPGLIIGIITVVVAVAADAVLMVIQKYLIEEHPVDAEFVYRGYVLVWAVPLAIGALGCIISAEPRRRVAAVLVALAAPAIRLAWSAYVIVMTENLSKTGGFFYDNVEWMSNVVTFACFATLLSGWLLGRRQSALAVLCGPVGAAVATLFSFWMSELAVGGYLLGTYGDLLVSVLVYTVVPALTLVAFAWAGVGIDRLIGQQSRELPPSPAPWTQP